MSAFGGKADMAFGITKYPLIKAGIENSNRYVCLRTLHDLAVVLLRHPRAFSLLNELTKSQNNFDGYGTTPIGASNRDVAALCWEFDND